MTLIPEMAPPLQLPTLRGAQSCCGSANNYRNCVAHGIVAPFDSRFTVGAGAELPLSQRTPQRAGASGELLAADARAYLAQSLCHAATVVVTKGCARPAH